MSNGKNQPEKNSNKQLRFPHWVGQVGLILVQIGLFMIVNVLLFNDEIEETLGANVSAFGGEFNSFSWLAFGIYTAGLVAYIGSFGIHGSLGKPVAFVVVIVFLTFLAGFAAWPKNEGMSEVAVFWFAVAGQTAIFFAGWIASRAIPGAAVEEYILPVIGTAKRVK